MRGLVGVCGSGLRWNFGLRAEPIYIFRYPEQDLIPDPFVAGLEF